MCCHKYSGVKFKTDQIGEETVCKGFSFFVQIEPLNNLMILHQSLEVCHISQADLVTSVIGKWNLFQMCSGIVAFPEL